MVDFQAFGFVGGADRVEIPAGTSAGGIGQGSAVGPMADMMGIDEAGGRAAGEAAAAVATL